MPQRTIAAGGGNWNSTGTWVEGAVPTSSDFVVGNASSGQLTINVAATCQYVDFTSYANTLTMNNTLTTGLAAATNTFGASMSFAGTSNFIVAAPQNITSSTTNRFSLRAQASITLLSNLYLINFETSTNSTFNGLFRYYISGNFSLVSPSGGIGGTSTFTMDGTGTFTSPNSLNGIGDNITFEINTSGTITFPSIIRFRRQMNFLVISGTIIPPLTIFADYQQTFTSTFQLGTTYFNTTTIFLRTLQSSGSLSVSTLRLLGNNSFYGLSMNKPSGVDNFNEMVLSGQTGFLINITEVILGQADSRGCILSFAPTTTYNITRLLSLGTYIISPPGIGFQIVRSSVSGTQAIVNILDNKNTACFYTQFTDINNSGGQAIKTWNGGVSNSSNITTYATDIFPTTSGGETSSVFIS